MRAKRTTRFKSAAIVVALLTIPVVGLAAASPAGASLASPTVTAVTPDFGPTAGGTSVTITGTNFGANFWGVPTVDFGTKPATGVSVISPTTIVVKAPALSSYFVGNTVGITVTTPFGTSPVSVADDFTYTYNNTSDPTNPISLSASTTSTTANSSVTLTATAVSDVGPTNYGLSILDVTNPASPLVLSHAYAGTSTQVSQANAQTHTYVAEYDACSAYPAPCPAGPAGSLITVPSDGAVSNPVTVTWTTPPPAAPAPTVNGVFLSSGPTSGGFLVTISGTNFTGVTAVHFGANQATVLLDTPFLLVAIIPAGSAGTVNVTVTTGGGTSAISPADQFTYRSGFGSFPPPRW